MVDLVGANALNTVFLDASGGDDSTDNLSALSTILSNASPGDNIVVTPGTYRLSDGITISDDNITFYLMPGATLKWTALGTSTNAITVSANNFTIRGGKLQGPTTATFVQDEHLIQMIGTSSASRKEGLYLFGVELTLVGHSGLQCKWVDHIRIQDCHFHDLSYSGAHFLSCNHGFYVNNRVQTIGPGTSSNMYGVSFTHASSGYSSDPDAASKDAANPFCWNWVVEGNWIEDVNWSAIDTHGAYEFRAAFNQIYNCKAGLQIKKSSGDAGNYGGWNNVLIGNIIDAANADGSTSSRECTGHGITATGGSVTDAHNDRLIIANNIVRNHGFVSNSTNGAIHAEQTNGAVITGNIVDLWGGHGIYLALTYGPLTISNNIIRALFNSGDTVARAISQPTSKALACVVTGNIIDADAGTAAEYGFVYNSGSRAPVITGNDFSEANTAETLSL